MESVRSTAISGLRAIFASKFKIIAACDRDRPPLDAARRTAARLQGGRGNGGHFDPGAVGGPFAVRPVWMRRVRAARGAPEGAPAGRGRCRVAAKTNGPR